MLSKQCPGRKRVENFIDTACKVVLTLSSSEDLSYWLVGLAREMRRACPLDTAARGVVKVSSNSWPKILKKAIAQGKRINTAHIGLFLTEQTGTTRSI